jgi:phage shock protein E
MSLRAEVLAMRSRWFVLLLLLLFSPSCSSHADKAGAPTSEIPASDRPTGRITENPAPAGPSAGTAATDTRTVATDAWAAIRSGALLVDVRTQAEYDQGHLEGALLIPHDQMAMRAAELGDDKSRAVVLYCRSGNRSSQAKKALEGLGFTDVRNAGSYETLKQAQ